MDSPRCGALRRCRTAAAEAAAEERAEQVAEVAHVEAAAEAACACTAAIARVNACKAELVILCALVLVGQHLIRLVDLL